MRVFSLVLYREEELVGMVTIYGEEEESVQEVLENELRNFQVAYKSDFEQLFEFDPVHGEFEDLTSERNYFVNNKS